MKFDLNKIRLLEWTDLYYFEMEINISIDALKSLSTNQEKTLSDIEQDFQKQIDEDQNLKTEYGSDFYTHVYETEGFTINELRKLQRYSIILSTHSFFEGKLKSLCEKIEHEFDFKIKIGDLKNNDDLQLYWTFLEKVYNIDMSSVEEFFTPIKQQKIVRNIIAHQEGFFGLLQFKKIQFLKGLEHEELFEGKYIILITNDEYLNYLLKNMRMFFSVLIELIDKQYEKLNNL